MKKIKPIIIKPSKRNGLAVAAQRRNAFTQGNKRRPGPSMDEWDWED